MIGAHSASWLVLRLMLLTWLASCASALAGERAQVDLSVSVSMTPATFIPGSRNLFSVTMHNAGPEDAGTINPDNKPVRVYGSSIIFPPTQPAPLEILGIQTGGCGFFRFSEPLPNGNWVVQFSYLFDPVAAGESRTCTSHIEFSAWATMDIPTNWQVDSVRDDDINPDNNRFDYTFIAAPPVPPASVPARSFLALACLGLALLLAGKAAIRHGVSTK